MKKITKKIMIVFAAFCMTMMFMSVTAHADTPLARNYDELVRVLNSGTEWLEIESEGDFGWPTEPTTVTLKGGIDVRGDWTIPSNVTINQQDTYFNNFDGSIIVNGTWNANRGLPQMIVGVGGKLVVKENLSFDKTVRIKNGGNLVLHDWFVASEGGTLILEKESKVQSINYGGIICISGGTLESDGAVLQVPLKSSAYSNYGYARTNDIKGKLTVEYVYMDGGQNLYITPGSSLTVTQNLNSFAGTEKTYITIGDKASLNLTGDGSYVSCDADIKVKSGGTLNDSSIGLTLRGNIRVYKGGVFNSEKRLFLRDKSVLQLDEGSKYYQRDGGLFVSTKGRDKGYVKGSGTITLSKNAYILDELKGIASTIKIVKESTPKPPTPPKKGAVLGVGDYNYTVRTQGKTLYFSGVRSKKITSATIPAYVTVEGIRYKVTGIYANAFNGCTRLKTVTIKNSSITSVSKYAFRGTPKKLLVKVPKARYSTYKKLMTNKGNTTMVMKYF